MNPLWKALDALSKAIKKEPSYQEDWVYATDIILGLSEIYAQELAHKNTSYCANLIQRTPQQAYRASGNNYAERVMLRPIQEYIAELEVNIETLHTLITKRKNETSSPDSKANLEIFIKQLNKSLSKQLRLIEKESEKDIHALYKKLLELKDEPGVDILLPLLKSTEHPEKIILNFYKKIEEYPKLKNKLTHDTVSNTQLHTVIEGLENEAARLLKKYNPDPDNHIRSDIIHLDNFKDTTPQGIARGRLDTLYKEIAYLKAQTKRCDLAKKITHKKLGHRLDILQGKQESTKTWSRFFNMEKYFKGSTGKTAIDTIKLTYKEKTLDEELDEYLRYRK